MAATGQLRDAASAQASEEPPSGVESVHAMLRRAILTGELKPGSTMSQVDLASRLGISRTMLREALRMLQREGLVRAQHNRRVRVAPLTAADVEGVYCARLSLEVVAVRLTVPRLDPDQSADLEGHLAQLVHFAKAEDYERWETVHRGFHHLLVAEAGDRLSQLLDELSDHAERYRRLYTTQSPRAWSSGSHEHRMILDAALARDADLAARRDAAHLAHTAFGVIELLEPEYEPARLREVVAHAVGREDPWRQAGRAP
jgi:GntR family transcriptional regulator, rspAB operon transcriptional repressor